MVRAREETAELRHRWMTSPGSDLRAAVKRALRETASVAAMLRSSSSCSLTTKTFFLREQAREGFAALPIEAALEDDDGTVADPFGRMARLRGLPKFAGAIDAAHAAYKDSPFGKGGG